MIYNFALIGAIVFLLFILNLVRKNKIDEKYSILWIILSLLILLVSLFPKIVIKCAEKIGVFYPPSLLFLVGIIIIGAYIVHITITITKQNKMIVKLTQELAILKNKEEEKDGENQ